MGVTFRALLAGSRATNTLAGIAPDWDISRTVPADILRLDQVGIRRSGDVRPRHPLTLFTVIAAVSAVLDTWLVFLPLSHLPRMKASLGKKVVVAVMFCLGGVAAMINLGRLVPLLDGPGRVGATKGTGVGYSYYGDALWTELEAVSGIVCACLPAVRLFGLWMWLRALRLACNRGEGKTGSAAACLPISRGYGGGRDKSGTGSLPSTASRTGLVQSDHELSAMSTACQRMARGPGQMGGQWQL